MSENAVLLQTLNQILSRLSTIEDKLEIDGGSDASGGKEDPKSIRDYDAFIREYVDDFEAKANALGGKAADLGRLVKEAFTEERNILYCAAECKAPAQLPQDLLPLMKPIGEKLKAVGALTMRDDFEFHCKAVEELVTALNWVMITPAPRDYVDNFIGASDFSANKIRMKYRGSDPAQIAFCDALKKILQELMSYIKQHHTTGLAWNKKSTVDFSSWKSPSSSGVEETKASVTSNDASLSASTPPPPPKEEGGGKAALFGELSKGLNITSGLKKVTKDQQTWRAEYKNEKEKPVPSSAPKKTLAPKPVAPTVHEPSTSFNQRQFKWDVSHHTSGIVNVNVENKIHSVYIYKCGNAVIDVRGTGKSILVDSCNKTQILCDEMISTVEFVNCKNIKFQVRENVPTVTIDKTDSIVTYLSWKSMACNFVTSKSSDMNVSYPKSEGSDDMEEQPIPEQFSSVLKRKEDGSVDHLETEVSDLYA